LTSFVRDGAGILLDEARPLVARDGLLLVRLSTRPCEKKSVLRLCVCNLLTGRRDLLPPLDGAGLIEDGVGGYAVLTAVDHAAGLHRPADGYSTFFQVLIAGVCSTDLQGYLVRFSSDSVASQTWSWSCIPRALTGGPYGSSVAAITRGAAHWLVIGTGHDGNNRMQILDVSIDTERVGVTEIRFLALPGLIPTDWGNTWLCPSMVDGRLSFYYLDNDQLRIWNRQDGTEVWQLTQAIQLGTELGLSGTESSLSTVCIGEKSNTMLVLNQQDPDNACVLHLRSRSSAMVAGWESSFNFVPAVPYEMNWSDFFMSRLAVLNAARNQFSQSGEVRAWKTEIPLPFVQLQAPLLSDDAAQIPAGLSPPPPSTFTLPMAEQQQKPAGIDPRSGFCTATRTFHSLREPVALPPESLPTTAAAYAFSMLPSPLPDRPAFIDAATGVAVSYPSFLAAVRSLAGGLWSTLGLRPGDVALVVSPSRVEVPVLDFALMSIGAVVSPANPASTADEYAHQVALSRPVVAFAEPEVAAKLPRHLRRIVIGSDEYTRLASDGCVPAPPAVSVKQSDTAAVMYSSGTTGRVKAVAVTHRNLVAMLCSAKANWERTAREAAAAGDSPPPPTVALVSLPLFHMFGFMMLLRIACMAETAVFMARFDLGAALRAVERHRVTLMPAAPPLLVAMAKSDEARRRDLSSLRFVAVGGAPLGREVAERFVAVFPNVIIVQAGSIHNGYGLTESTGSVSRMVGPEECKAYGSVGKLASDMEAKIVDPATGEALGPGQRGELWTRGPSIMKGKRHVSGTAIMWSLNPTTTFLAHYMSHGMLSGYVNDDKGTAATLDSEGWLKTGDLCYFNEDGFLYIVDRLKELIKYKGYQVPPAELEHILHSHPEIMDAGVVPYPDEDAGQLPMAFIVRKPGSHITEQQIMDYVAKHVAPYKKVRRVAFISEIPKSPAGKILRRELVQQALASMHQIFSTNISSLATEPQALPQKCITKPGAAS
ncbi:hypothetical protein EJB05_56306, partial [Eragrostis curvula]